MESNSLIEKLGGRKFVLAMIAVAVGTAIEVTTTRGVSGSFAGLLAGIVAAFGAANAVITNRAMSVEADASEPVGELTPAVDLSPINNELAAVKDIQGRQGQVIEQLAQGLSNNNKLVTALFKTQPQG